MKTSDVLLHGAELIKDLGHCKRSYANEAGAICALEALDRVCGGERDAYVLLAFVVGGPIAPWNDAPERTPAEVIEALRSASDLAAVEDGEVPDAWRP